MRGARAAHVVLTGATGFVGKVVLEELLRRREALGISHVTLLVRPQTSANGKPIDVKVRLAKVLASAAFDGIRKNDPEALATVSAVACELSHKNAGIAPEARALLASLATHVVHCAASIAFDAPLPEAANNNVTSALEVLAFAKEIEGLERMVSVSTAYVTAPRRGPITEVLAHLPRPAEALYEEALAGTADTAARLAETGHPNTYTYTKCIAEHMLVARRGAVPLTILRPSIVSAAQRTPSPGWIDSAAAFAGCMLYVGLGVVRAWEADPGVRLDVVPVDAVARAIVDEAFAGKGSAFEPPRVRHATMGIERALRVDASVDAAVRFFRERPGARALPGMFVGRAEHGFAVADLKRRVLPLMVARTRLAVEKSQAKRKILEKTDAHVRELNTSFRAFTHHTFDFRAKEPLALPGYEPREYLDLALRGIYRHLVRRDETELTFAGKTHDDGRGDVAWALEKPEGNRWMRALAVGLRRAMRAAMSRVTFDRPSFERAMAKAPADAIIVLAPMHRSYFDFLLTSYLCFQHPELGIRVPHIAAAEEFSRIPLASRVLTASRAFYVKRGEGRASPELNATLARLVAREESLLFFVEGQRSRGRRTLAPRRGILRGLQATGRTFAVLPIAIDYDRVPEEESLGRELRGMDRDPMSLGAVVRWLARLSKGDVSLGRAHFACGEPVVLDPSSDVVDVADRVVREQRRVTTISTYHLRSLLESGRVEGIELASLVRAVTARGLRVLKSELAPATAGAETQRSLESSYMHAFYPDVRALVRLGPALTRHLEANAFGKTETAERDPSVAPVVRRLFLPVVRDHLRVARAVATLFGTLTAPAIVRTAPEAFLPDVHDALVDLAAKGFLATADGKTFTRGPNAAKIDEHIVLLEREERAVAALGQRAESTTMQEIAS